MHKTDIEFVQEALRYDPDTGVFVWRLRPLHHFSSASQMSGFNTRFAGKVAGTVEKRKHTDYQKIRVGESQQYAHILAWLMTHGEYPESLLDHKNGNGLDNRIDNLRLGNPVLNARNTNKSKRNKTGITGVHIDRQGMFVAQGREGSPLKSVTLHRGSLFEAACSRRSWEIRNQFTERHGR